MPSHSFLKNMYLCSTYQYQRDARKSLSNIPVHMYKIYIRCIKGGKVWQLLRFSVSYRRDNNNVPPSPKPNQ